jgi:hypothetical protein
MSRDNLVSAFVQGLKSRTHQNKTAQELLLYVKTELREMPQDELLTFLDEFNHHIFDMIQSADISEKKGGVLAISRMINVNDCNFQLMKYFYCVFRMSREWRCREHNNQHFTIPQHSSRIVSIE